MSRVCCVLELSTYLGLILDMCLIRRLGHSAMEGEETVSVPISGVFYSNDDIFMHLCKNSIAPITFNGQYYCLHCECLC